MYILGICNDETASACLMKNGEIIFAASEERFSRKKLDNSFPQKSIESCLNFAKIELKDVDAIAYAWAKGFQEDLVEKYLILGARCADDKQALDIAKERIKWEIDRDKTKRKEFDDWVEENIDQRKQTVFDFFHHEAHAASAAFYSPFDEGFVYTSDGRGDFEATTIYKFNRHSNEALTKIFSTPSSNSFGFFYGRITGLLGFKPMRHEGKITGLAAF
ncbi:carbamoyl transferase, partial [Alphaproteobacteria bacterium]|nr:carbamoyl transferase [Alphaproteobacteria bacterium]